MQSIRFALVGALVMGAASIVSAQQATPAQTPDATAPHHRGGHGAFLKDLGLSADQQAKVDAIHAKYKPKFAAARKSAKPDMDAARAARQRGDTAAARAAFEKVRESMKATKPLRDQEMAEIRALLTPEQQQKFDAKRAELKNHAHQAGNGMHRRHQSATSAAKAS